VSEVLHLDIWKINVAAVTYLIGLLLFIAGLAIARAHNRWIMAWPVTIISRHAASAVAGCD
jgi:hypothetical protein